MKRILLLSSFLFAIADCFAQSEYSYNWFFGSNAGLNFSGGAPVAQLGGQINTVEGCSSISDDNGNLLFYSDGVTVWNANHNQMPNGFGLAGGPSSTQSALIVRVPNSVNDYYIFTPAQACQGGFSFSTVDMTLNGGLGDIVLKNQLLIASSSEKVCAVLHGNCNDIWIIAYSCGGSNTFYVYLMTSAGLNTTPQTTNIGTTVSSGGDEIGYLKASPDGAWLCQAKRYDHLCELFTFDKYTGTISNLITLNFASTYPAGVEFSCDASKLYIAANLTNAGMWQFDLSSGNAATIIASQTLINSNANIYALQRAADGKIYCAIYLSGSCAVINNPDALGAACNFVLNGVGLGGPTNLTGLPGFINTIGPCNTCPLINDSLFCLGDFTAFWLTDTVGVDSIFWNFGDPGSGAANTSNLLFPTHQFSAADTFNVSVIFYIAGVADTASDEVIITPVPIINLGNDTTLCPNESLLLDAFYVGAAYLWQDGSGNSTYNVTTAGTYWVQLTLGACDFSDTIIVDYATPLVVNLGNDTTVCFGEIVSLVATNAGAVSYLWQDGSVNSTFNASVAGTYWVIITDPFGCEYGDTINIFYQTPLVLNLGNDTIICNGSSFVVDAFSAGAISYLWQDGSVNSFYNISLQGNYWVEVFDGICYAYDSINVVFDIPPVVDLGNDTIVCEGQPVFIDGTTAGALTYQWQDGSSDSTYTTNTTGVYWLIISDGLCTDVDSLVVTNFPPINLDLGSDTTICENAQLVLDATNNNAVYLWQDSSISPVFIVSQNGTYHVTVTANGCTKSDTITVSIYLLPVVDIGVDTVICYEESILLDAGNPGCSYDWQDGSHEQTLLATWGGDYYVEVANYCGTDVDSIIISNEICGCEIYAPNAFTPNNDGLNDVFKPIYGACDFANYSLTVYNRWGQLIFQSLDREAGWDGTFAGIEEEIGVYVFVISYTASDNGSNLPYFLKGQVTLLR